MDITDFNLVIKCFVKLGRLSEDDVKKVVSIDYLIHSKQVILNLDDRRSITENGNVIKECNRRFFNPIGNGGH